MSAWLFNVYMNGVKEVKIRMGRREEQVGDEEIIF